jgi:hypothetical protein
MTKYIFVILFTVTCLVGNAQRNQAFETDSRGNVIFGKRVKKERYKIAVLTPLYLDSIDLEKNLANIPKFMMPGLDFYQGIQIAADTLRKQGFKLDIYVHDSKSAYLNVQNIIETDRLDSMDLIIGNASVSDLKLLGEFAKSKKINFISAVSPSDAEQESNPYFTILQPRLASHIERMHKHINVRHPEDNVFYLYGNSQSEKNGLNYFQNDFINPIPGRFKAIEIKDENAILYQLKKNIDTNYHTTIFLGVLDPSTTYKYLKILAPMAEKYNLTVYCMPTTEAIKSLSKTNEFPNLPVYYTTAYIIDKITPASMYIAKKYKARMGGLTSDVVYKGFESLFYFANMMKKYGVPFNDNLGDNSNSFITPYKIMPVKENGIHQFNENKFLYLMRYENGIMTYE